jgi:hypothetical protein
MLLKGSMRGRPALKRWWLGCGTPWGIPCSVVKPYGVTLARTSLVSQGSQASLKADTSAVRKAHGHPPGEDHGASGPPVFPSVQRLGSRKARTGQGDAHATSIVLLESSLRNTGGSSEDAKSSGDVGRGKRLMKARCRRGQARLRLGVRACRDKPA